MADTGPDAPEGSTLDERKPKGTSEQQLAAFDDGPAEAPDPETPEEDEKPMAGAGRSAGVADSPGAATALSAKPASGGRARATVSTGDAAKPSQDIGRDSAAAPVSPPASDPNAATSAQVKTSAPPQPATPANPKPQSSTLSPNAQTVAQHEQPQQGTAPINAATMVAGALTGAFRRPETPSRPAAVAAPADPRSAPQSLLNRFAVKNILDTLRGPQDHTAAAPKPRPVAANAEATTSARAPATNAATAPGGLRDKLTTFTAERMQPRRDAEQIRGATWAATGVVASLQALEQQETTGILMKIRDAAKANGGIEHVLSEMRPGGRFEDLRKEFNTVLSHDQGFAAAYDKATSAVADYAETRAAMTTPSRPRGDPNLLRLQTLDQEIAEAAKNLPGIKDGKGALEELVETGKEAVQKLFSTVQQAFSRDADLRGPSPSPGLGR
jgi:hypothetical protein